MPVTPTCHKTPLDRRLAMLFKPLLGTALSGALGGIVASHNRGGAYFRANTVPTDPGTPQQIIIRTILTNLALAWQTELTVAQRQGWETYADNVPVTNRIGETIFLTGQQMYVRNNTAREQAGLARINKPPVIFSLATLTAVTVGAVEITNVLTITFDNTDEWANFLGGALLVWGSRQQARTINFFKGPYRFAGSILGDPVTPPTSPDPSIINPFAMDAGNLVFLRFVAVQADGRISAPQVLGQTVIGV